MNIRLKLVLSAAALAAGCVLLAGCGGSASSASSAASSAASSDAASPSASSEPTASVSAEENGASDAVASAVDALLETNPISNQFEIDALSIEYDFFLDADDVVTYKGIKSNDNGDAGLILAVEAADGKVQNVIDGMKQYQQLLINNCENYPDEFAQALQNANDAIIDNNGNLVVMVVASNDCSSDLTSAVKDVLGK